MENLGFKVWDGFLLLPNILLMPYTRVALEADLEMQLLLASCPKCQDYSLYCGRVRPFISDLDLKDVLFCSSCKLILPVEEFKKILFSE